jgi:acyl-CoA synthetase (AMP-forming)/AMP-acid ligase II
VLAQAGVKVCITDPDISEPVPLGEIGMIKVCGPNVCQGYWWMLEKTHEELRAKGFTLTGDIGKIVTALQDRLTSLSLGLMNGRMLRLGRHRGLKNRTVTPPF